LPETAPSSQYLADTLKRAGFMELAARAERNEFHDFLSDHALPEMELDMALVAIIKDPTYSNEKRDVASRIRARHHEGAFDATKAESDAWAASPDGQATIGALVKDLKP
jgi:hypothetical protein